HLFPFRTEQLSPLVAMIVLWAKVARRQNNVFKLKTVNEYLLVFCYNQSMKLLLTSGGLTDKRIPCF
ncbi:MAG: hypothetical protein AAB661_00765, partial [Patescibacteria group bacterium]